MFERPNRGDRVLLVQVGPAGSERDWHTQEFVELAHSAGAEIVDILITNLRDRPHPATFIGSGKLETLKNLKQETAAELIIFNHRLSGIQERNLEKALECRVIDRVGLILDIFSQRAKSAEGKLQVELAQLAHASTRLVRGWTHLERQKGGIGLRGPGETQLETDRRLIGNRIVFLKEKLAKIQRQRTVQRRARQKTTTKNIALVGYTNAGKSTLFNRLTKAKTLAANQLFATLDPTTRRFYVANCLPLTLSDTVGFIRDLPHELIAAFRATLSEVLQADLLLHVIDNHHPDRDDQISSVDKTLREIGAEHIPRVRVLNKCDLSHQTPGLERGEYGKIESVRLSAATGDGITLLRQLLRETFPNNSLNGNESSKPQTEFEFT